EPRRRLGETQNRFATAPRPRLGAARYLRANWVELDVLRGRHELRIVVDELCEVPSLEEMAGVAMASVEAVRVQVIQEMHSNREVRLRRSDKQVVMVRHQAEPQALPREEVDDLLEKLEERETVE